MLGGSGRNAITLTSFSPMTGHRRADTYRGPLPDVSRNLSISAEDDSSTLKYPLYTAVFTTSDGGLPIEMLSSFNAPSPAHDDRERAKATQSKLILNMTKLSVPPPKTGGALPQTYVIKSNELSGRQSPPLRIL